MHWLASALILAGCLAILGMAGYLIIGLASHAWHHGQHR